MALDKRLRLSLADQENSGYKDSLNQLLYRFLPVELHGPALDSIEETGTISDDIYKKAIDRGLFRPQDLAAVKSNFNAMTGKLRSKEGAYTKIIDDLKNEADLTDESLQDKISAYEGLGKTGPVADTAGIRRTVDEMLGTSGVLQDLRKLGGTDAGEDNFKNSLVNFIAKNRRLPTPGEFGFQGSHLPSWQNFLNDQNNKNRIAMPLQPSNYAGDIKRIQDILTGRADERGKASDEQQFLAQTPAELAASRQQFLAEREAAAGKQLVERVTPDVLAELNTRGLAESPDVVSEVARRGASMQATIEQQLRDLETQDAQFFADAAFRIQTAKLNQKQADFRSSLAAERALARQQQQNNFKITQDRINSDFELDMLKREQERNLRLNQDQLNFDSSTRRAASEADAAGQVGSAAGQIIGTKIATRTSSPTVNNTTQNSTTSVTLPRVG